MKKIELIKLDLKDLYLIKPFISSDSRGIFIKDYSDDLFAEFGINFKILETFMTYSKNGVIEAIHFQKVKEQGKIIRCIKGKIYDVAVDLRPFSPTFKKYYAIELNDQNNFGLLIPKGFGHGYLVIEDAIVSYQCDQVFFSEYDSGIIWNDKSLNIKWPISDFSKLIFSEKDKNLPTFEQYFNNTK